MVPQFYEVLAEREKNLYCYWQSRREDEIRDLRLGFRSSCARDAVFATISLFSEDQPVLTRRIKVRIEPSYPERARPLKLAGKVRVEVIVSPDGSIKNTRVVGGSPLLVDASLEAIKQWKFEPGPKETVEKIEFLFQLK